MNRFQKALPMSAVRGDEMGFRPFRKKQRRRRRRRREPIPEYYPDERYAEEVQLQRIPGARAPAPAPSARPDGGWGPLTQLSENMRVQARRGHRAAVVELQPGMYIVAEVPEEMVRPQIGVLPLLAPLLMLAANRALKRRMKQQQHAEPEVVYEPPPPRRAPRQLTGPTTPAPWVSPEDYQTVVSGHSCDCGHRR